MFFSFKNFLKGSLFIVSILLLILISTGISYYVIDITQQKNNLMDIEEMPPPHPPHKLPVYEAKTNFSATKEVGCTIIRPKCLDQSNNQ